MARLVSADHSEAPGEAQLPPSHGNLGRRGARRALVFLLVAAIALMIAAAYAGVSIFGAFLLVLILFINVRLRQATDRLAVVPVHRLDERQEAVRNRSYRLSHRIIAIAFGVPLWLLFLGSGGPIPTWLTAAAQNTGIIVAYLEILLFLPTAVIAWTEPDEEYDGRPATVSRFAWLPWLVILSGLVALMVGWSLALLLPGRVSSMVRPYPHMSGRTSCSYFGATAQVGRGIGAGIPLNAEICWNGKSVWQAWGVNADDCQMHSEFLTHVTETCRTRFSPTGAMHVAYRATVTADLLPFLQRTVGITLVVRPDGHVVRFP